MTESDFAFTKGPAKVAHKVHSKITTIFLQKRTSGYRMFVYMKSQWRIYLQKMVKYETYDNETIQNVIASCSKLVKSNYKYWHNQVA